MTPGGYQAHKDQLLKELDEVHKEAALVKAEIASAKREFAATGRGASREWLAEGEGRLEELKRSGQEIQRQIASMNAVGKKQNLGLDDFVYEVLCERMEREEVGGIFREAMVRRRLHLDS